MGGLFDSKTYKIWRNVPYAEGYGKTLIGSDRSQLASHELEQIDRYFRNLFIETPTNQGITVSHAMETSLANPRVMAELLHMDTSFGSKDHEPAINGGSGKKRLKTEHQVGKTKNRVGKNGNL